MYAHCSHTYICMDSSALKLRAQYRSFQLFQFEKCISRHFHFRIFVHCSPKDYVMRKVKFIQMREFTHTPRNFDAVEKVLSVSYKIIYICILLLVWRGGDTERVVSEWVCVCVKSTGNSVFQRFYHSFHYYIQLSLCVLHLSWVPHKSAICLFHLFPFFIPFTLLDIPTKSVTCAFARSLQFAGNTSQKSSIDLEIIL